MPRLWWDACSLPSLPSAVPSLRETEEKEEEEEVEEEEEEEDGLMRVVPTPPPPPPPVAARWGCEKRFRDSRQQAPLTTLSLSASTGVYTPLAAEVGLFRGRAYS